LNRTGVQFHILRKKKSRRGFSSVAHYKNVMPSFGALLVSLIAVPFCFYMIAERREEKKLNEGQGKPTDPNQESPSPKARI
jgi:hypothetical protein